MSEEKEFYKKLLGKSSEKLGKIFDDRGLPNRLRWVLDDYLLEQSLWFVLETKYYSREVGLPLKLVDLAMGEQSPKYIAKRLNGNLPEGLRNIMNLYILRQNPLFASEVNAHIKNESNLIAYIGDAPF